MSVRGIAIALMAVAVGGTWCWVISAGGADAIAVQMASASDRFRSLFSPGGSLSAALIASTREQLRRDYVLIVVYTVGLVLVILATGRRRPLGRRAPTTLAVGAAFLAALFDVLENLATSMALDHLDHQTPLDASWVTRFAMAKWILLVTVVGFLLLRAMGTPRRRQTGPSVEDAIGHSKRVRSRRYRLLNSRDDVPITPEGLPPGPKRQGAAPWIVRLARRLFVDEPVTEPEPTLEQPVGQHPGRHIGVACSGGGIRSASFTLGAVQVLREEGVLRRASHVTAVSGGGYLAAGWAIAASSVPAAASEVFGAGSPEEGWLRRHSNLLPNVRTALEGVGRALMGMVVNLLVIWLVLMVASRPIGWLEHVVHPELSGRRPYISILDQPSVRSAGEQPADLDKVCVIESAVLHSAVAIGDPSDAPTLCIGSARDIPANEPGGPVRAWEVVPSLKPAKVAFQKDSDSYTKILVQPAVTPGLVGVVEHRLVVLRQPLAGFPDGALPAAHVSNASPDAPSLVISRQPKLRVVDPSVPEDRPKAVQLRLSAPRIDQHSGTTGRQDLDVKDWMWLLVGLTVALYAVVGLARAISRPVQRRSSRFFHIAAPFAAVVAIATLAILAVIPWLVHEIPLAVARLVTALPGPDTPGAQSGDATAVGVAGGTAVLTVATVIHALRGPVVLALHRWPMAVLKVAVAIVLVIVPFVLFIDSVAIAAANGPGGHLVGSWAGRLHVPLTLLRTTSDLARWFVALAVLVFWRHVCDAHALSLFPFYKRRMNESFAVERKDGSAAEVNYATELAWASTDKSPQPAKGFGLFCLDDQGCGRKDCGPELVLCTTANTYRAGEVPSSRRATPFTFSSTVIGGPDVGYLPTKDYLDALGKDRRKDVTIAAVLAIAGAAFSPGMGKMSMGPIDNLLAITNARLGVWIPHPAFVAEQIKNDSNARWRDRPGWPWFLREFVSAFRLGTPYLYLTDGGHWENLGMVEVLRRGCRHVVVISAAGDGLDGFSTIGEAIALAREELELEIVIDLEPMRAPRIAPADSPAQSLRRGDGGAPTVAPAAYCCGEIRDVRAPNQVEGTHYGTIVIMEANLTADLPWDVASWAEGHVVFPDDPTSDQNFNHRQFESYRRLGRFQMTKALADDEVRRVFCQ